MYYFEIEFASGFGICIKSFVEKFSKKSLDKFLVNDIKEFGDIVGVYPIEKEEARLFYDFENEDKWPIFSEVL